MSIKLFIKLYLSKYIFLVFLVFAQALSAQSSQNVMNIYQKRITDIIKLSQYPNLSPVPDKWTRTQIPFEEFIDKKNLECKDNEVIATDTVLMATVNFRVNNSLLEAEYLENSKTLKEINKVLAEKENLDKLDYILIIAGSSPEGGIVTNQKLAVDRAQAMRSYIMWKYPHLNRDLIYSFSIGEDWIGLRNLVENDINTPYRTEALSIIDSIEDRNERLLKIKTLGKGDTYKYMLKYMLPKLRGSTTIALHFKKEIPFSITQHSETDASDQKQEKELSVESMDHNENTISTGDKKSIELNENRSTDNTEIINSEDTLTSKGIEEQLPNDGICYTKFPLLALKTNLLSDIISGVNIEIEVPIGKRWSVLGEYVFPWWLYESKQIALQSLNGTLETRYWFGDRSSHNKLTGLFMGIYGGAGYYDIEWLKNGYQGEFFHTGISGGYAHTISKYGDFRMEYSLGLGYLGTKYREYEAIYGLDNEWHLIRRRNGTTRYFGPTRAKISIVWMLNKYVANK